MQDATKTFAVVSVLDRALDREEMNLEEYKRTRDVSLVRERAGEKAARFYLKPIPTTIFQRLIHSASSDGDKAMFAFMYAVSKVENYVSPEGEKQANPWTPNGKIQLSSGTESICSEDDLSHFTPAQIDEIGAIAYERSFLGPANVQAYPLPHTLDRALAAMSQYHAATQAP